MPLYLSCGIKNNNKLLDDINNKYNNSNNNSNNMRQYHILFDRNKRTNDSYKGIKEQFEKLPGNIVELSISDISSLKNISDDSLILVYLNGKSSASGSINFTSRYILKTLIQRSEKSKLIFIAFNDLVSIISTLSRNLLFSTTAQIRSSSYILQKIENEQIKPLAYIQYLLTNNSFIKYLNGSLSYHGNIFKCKQKQWQQYKNNKFIDI